jgi:pimeloyl-ACP methyl ester carboxylesterase
VNLHTVDRGSGHPVLLLHGQPGSAASWLPLTRLLEPGYRVLAPDRPGYGSTGGEALGLEANAEVIGDLLVERGGFPATVVGHSWSGGVAVMLAAGWPELVSDLVLVGAACTPDSIDLLDRLLALPVVGEAATVAGLFAIDAVLPRVRRLSGRAPPAIRDRVFAALPDEDVFGDGRGALGRNLAAFVTEQRALLAEIPAVTRTLAAVTVPATVVAGEWDLVVRPSAADTLAAALPRAELVMLRRVGHFVARDAPEELADAIASSARRGAGPGSSPHLPPAG